MYISTRLGINPSVFDIFNWRLSNRRLLHLPLFARFSRIKPRYRHQGRARAIRARANAMSIRRRRKPKYIIARMILIANETKETNSFARIKYNIIKVTSWQHCLDLARSD